MSSIFDKKQMTEEDIKLNFITPALMSKGWKDRITMETKITDGRINLKGNIASREVPKKADYILYINKANPLAVVEAKDNNHSISFGMQQAKLYAQMLDVKFAYSSNGDGFQEFDFLTGIEREITLEEFPTPDELFARYKAEINDGQGLSKAELSFIEQPFYSSQTTYSPRYYQRNAVNRTLDAIAKGQNRLLLVMATGTGKTYTAFQIVYRLLQTGARQKILYLADRNNLIDQTIGGDFKPLEKVMHKINFVKDNRTTITSYQVYFSLYQQLVGNKKEDDDESDEEVLARYSALFDKDFFDLIIVDECHRGSAKEESRWRKILEYFSSATQIGMTATPKETESISNIDYFGKPIYVYSLKEGIADGFLAPFKVINVKSDIGDGWRPRKGQVDIYGYEIEDRIYNNSDFDYKIIIQDRIDMVAREITNYLKATDRMAKTIVFCATEDAAERMRVALTKCNADMIKQNPDYVVRITGSDDYGKEKLDYFISVSAKYPVIATTSKLLSTGVDCKMVKLIVLDEMINSMTEFKQIIGRGTRIREQDGKTHFMIMDFRGVTRLFADSDWDGPVEQDENFVKVTPGDPPSGIIIDTPPVPPVPLKHKWVVDNRGCKVQVLQKVVSIYDVDGKLLRQESIIDYTKTNISGEFATLSDFISTWSAEEKKEKIYELFLQKGIDLDQVKAEENLSDVDDFDFICHVAYNQKPLTRKERAENVKKRNVFGKYGEAAREVLNALLDKYADSSIYEIEDIDVLKLDPFTKFGKPSKIAQLFGGKEGYLEAMRLLKQEIYKVVA